MLLPTLQGYFCPQTREAGEANLACPIMGTTFLYSFTFFHPDSQAKMNSFRQRLLLTMHMCFRDAQLRGWVLRYQLLGKAHDLMRNDPTVIREIEAG